MNKIARKIGVAVIALVTIVSVSGITPAVAQTPAELQTQINALLAQITALQAQIAGAPAPAPAAVFNFTRNLTLGSTGEDVKALQQFLNTQGFAVAATGAGSAGNESTTFGPRTQAALVRFQEANNISPALGFFGPVTRARIATLIPAPVVPPVVVTPPVVTPPVAEAPAVEGTLSARLLPSPLGVEVSIGEVNRSVAAFELEAKQSNIRVQRVDVRFAGPTDDRPWRAFNRVALSVGGEVVATRTITGSADFIEGSGTHTAYTLRFSGINANIPVNARQAWTVQVSANPVVETDSRGAWTVTVPDNGVRGIDGAGVSHTVSLTPVASRGFTLRAEEVGALAVTLNANNLADRVVQVDDENMTEGVQLLAFDVRATRRAVTVEEVNATVNVPTIAGTLGGVAPDRTITFTAPVVNTPFVVGRTYTIVGVGGTSTFAVTSLTGTNIINGTLTGATENEAVTISTVTDKVAPIAKLYRGTTLVGSATVPANGVVRFDDMESRIERDSTATFTVRVDLNHLVGATYVAGTTVSATLGAVRGIDGGENPITATGTATGNLARLFTVAPSWALVGTPTISQVSVGDAREATAQIVVDITALGGDIFIQRGVGVLGAALGTGNTLTQAMTAASIANDTDGATWGHIVREGTTRRFTVSGNLSRAGALASTGFAGMEIASITWDTDNNAVAPSPVPVTSTSGLDAFETAQVTISKVVTTL